MREQRQNRTSARNRPIRTGLGGQRCAILVFSNGEVMWCRHCRGEEECGWEEASNRGLECGNLGRLVWDFEGMKFGNGFGRVGWIID